jgi:acetolactate synthase-1/2/3 large subunit
MLLPWVWKACAPTNTSARREFLSSPRDDAKEYPFKLFFQIMKTKKSAAAKSTATPDRGKVMNGAEILVECLEREGVEVVFAYPGGCSMPIHQALTKTKKIRTILPRHEQGGVFAAEGYARVTGKVGVCMATSGPGATNLVTGIADAFMDSIPLVAITGQVPQEMIGRGAFQETDVFGMTLPMVKHSYLVWDVNELPRIVKEAFHIASTGRPGPVLIDIPKNIQNLTTQPIFPKSVNLRGYKPERKADDVALNELIGMLAEAKAPMIYCGGGVISGEASAELIEFAERSQIPVATTLMGIGGFPETHALSLKWLGMHGTVYANNAVNEADLLLAIGVRFDDRVTGKVEKFCEHGKIVHIDIDNSEINKNKTLEKMVKKIIDHFTRDVEFPENFYDFMVDVVEDKKYDKNILKITTVMKKPFSDEDSINLDEIKRKSVRGLLKKRAKEYNSDEEV